MSARAWIEVSLTVPASYQDLLVGQLGALGFHGFLQEEDTLKAYLDSRNWNKGLRERLEYCLRQFQGEFPHLRLPVTTVTVGIRNWNKTWERSVGILEPAPGIVIKPSWKRLPARHKGKIILHIDPKMSFGTGHHESTRLCLRFLRDHIQPGMSVLDFGSGTGILAIGAVKLGAGHAVAIDNDPWTIPNIRENVRRNRVGHKVRIIPGDAQNIPRTSFDLIVANIDLPTITKVHTRLVRRLRKGGILILAGLLKTDLISVHALFRHSNFAPFDILEENEWAAMALSKS